MAPLINMPKGGVSTSVHFSKSRSKNSLINPQFLLYSFFNQIQYNSWAGIIIILLSP